MAATRLAREQSRKRTRRCLGQQRLIDGELIRNNAISHTGFASQTVNFTENIDFINKMLINRKHDEEQSEVPDKDIWLIL